MQHQLSKPNMFLPTTFEQAERYAEKIANSSICPKDFKGKPGDVLIAMQMGAEVGLSPLQAIQNIAVINGRPSIWGDAALAIVRVHKDFESIKEWTEGTISSGNAISYCSIKRTGEDEIIRHFSYTQAKSAGIINNPVWKNYPDRMLQMRARGFCLRDSFADALKGLNVAEEVSDYQVIECKTINENQPEKILQLQKKIDDQKNKENDSEKTDQNSLENRVEKALAFFKKKGIEEEKILAYFGIKSKSEITIENISVLQKVLQENKEGTLNLQDEFSKKDNQEEAKPNDEN